MRLLLDTHALIWFSEASERLSQAARCAIADPRNERWVSHATPWEAAIKVSLGKLKLDIPFEDLFPGVVLANGWRFLPTELRHYRQLLALPLHHRDPFDRLLISQAQVEDLTVVTSDPEFPAYGVPLLW